MNSRSHLFASFCFSAPHEQIAHVQALLEPQPSEGLSEGPSLLGFQPFQPSQPLQAAGPGADAGDQTMSSISAVSLPPSPLPRGPPPPCGDTGGYI